MRHKWGIPVGPNKEHFIGAAFARTLLLAGIAILVLGCRKAKDESRLTLLRSETGPICGLKLSPDGKFLAISTADHDVKILDFNSGRELVTLLAYEYPVFTPDRKKIIAGAWVPQGKARKVDVWDVSLLISRHLVDTLSEDGPEVWRAGNKNHLLTWYPSGNETRVVLSPDGSRMGLPGWKSISLYDWVGDGVVERFSFEAYNKRVSELAFSPDGQIMATSGDDREEHRESPRASVGGGPALSKGMSVKLWDSNTGQRVGLLPMPESFSAVGLAFFPDGKSLVAGCNSPGAGSVLVWDLANIAAAPRKLVTTDSFIAWAISTDAKLLALGTGVGPIELWDLREFCRIRILSGHTDIVYALEFTPDTKALVSASHDGSVKVWDIDSAENGSENLTFRKSGL